MRDSQTGERPLASISGLLGVGLYAAIGLMYLSSGLVVPVPWVVLLWLVWAGGWYVVFLVYRARRAWVPMVALGAVVFWWIYVSLGGAFLGWTA